MPMDMKGITSWVEEHPTESIVIGLGGTLALLWLLGFFSSSSSNSNAGASNLAAAYYAAEAQQAVVGGQIQIATIGAAASTRQNADNANAAVAINAANTTAATTINGQNADASVQIGNQGLLATYSNNSALVQDTASNNATAATIAANNNQTSLLSSAINTVIPAEIAAHMGGFSIPGLIGWGQGTGQPYNVNDLMAQGYTQAQALNIASGRPAT
jgi:hypothetical protein